MLAVVTALIFIAMGNAVIDAPMNDLHKWQEKRAEIKRQRENRPQAEKDQEEIDKALARHIRHKENMAEYYRLKRLKNKAIFDYEQGE